MSQISEYRHLKHVTLSNYKKLTVGVIWILKFMCNYLGVPLLTDLIVMDREPNLTIILHLLVIIMYCHEV